MKKLVRFRVLSDGFAAGGISLPKGDYDGDISWSEQSVMGFPNRVNGPSNIYLTPASLPAARHLNSRGNCSPPGRRRRGHQAWQDDSAVVDD